MGPKKGTPAFYPLPPKRPSKTPLKDTHLKGLHWPLRGLGEKGMETSSDGSYREVPMTIKKGKKERNRHFMLIEGV